MSQLKLNNISKYYLINASLVLGVIFSICVMFFVQFKVDNLQDRVNEVENQISAYEDEIKVLEVEWVYLTRPERLRILSEKYLQDNSYTASSQVKDIAQIEEYSKLALAKEESKPVAMNDLIQ